ncbi:Ubiquitin carboxyl-terminal hydrolase 26 [Diplonema papillatum]|nr:Ubiquitin carboxyl-terminal hydrolase 26 [Diplonema papillatum]
MPPKTRKGKQEEFSAELERRKAYSLVTTGAHQPRTLSSSCFTLRTESDVEEFAETIVGGNPKDRLGSAGDQPTKGLRNLGLTCYINAVLQCLSNEERFVSELFRLTPTDVPTKELQRVIHHMRRKDDMKWIDPEPLIVALEVCSVEQQDAHEFYRLLLDYLAVENARDELFRKEMNSMFEGGMLYTTTCSNCSKSTPRHENCTELTLVLPPGKGVVSLEDGLTGQFGEAVQLCDDNQYLCEACKGKQDAERSAKLCRLPEMLVFTFGRFSYDIKKGNKVKKQNTVTYPQQLDMTPWLSANAKLDSVNYRLSSSIHHHGTSAHGGHYVARWLDPETDTWWLFDDTTVKRDNAKTASSNFDEARSRMTSNDAYMLVYTRLPGDAPRPKSPARTREARKKREAARKQLLATLDIEADAAVAVLHEKSELHNAQRAAVMDSLTSVTAARKDLEVLRKTKYRAADFPAVSQPLDDYVFISSYWLHAFGSGALWDAQADAVYMKREGLHTKGPYTFVDAPAAPSAQNGKGEAAPPAAGDAEKAVVPVHRNPCHPGNYLPLQCPHCKEGEVKIDPSKTRAVKVMRTEEAELLWRAAGCADDARKKKADFEFSPVPLSSGICEECIAGKAAEADSTKQATARREEMLTLAQIPPDEQGVDGPLYWVSLKFWNRWKLKTQAKHAELLESDLLENVRCQHQKLSPNVSARKLISEAHFLYLTQECDYPATEPYLTNSDAECAQCRKKQDSDMATWNIVQATKKEFKRTLKAVTDAVNNHPDESLKPIVKDWPKERSTLHKEWERKVKKIRAEKEKLRKAAEKVDKKGTSEEEKRPSSPPLTGGYIDCSVCNKKRLQVAGWPAHLESKGHKQAAAANNLKTDEDIKKAAREDEQAEQFKRDNVVDCDAEESEETSEAQPKRAKTKNDRDEEMKDSEEADKDDNEEAEEDEETEDETPEDEREPSQYINAEYTLIPLEWGQAFVAWVASTKEETQKPPPMDPACLYCDHGANMNDCMRYRPPLTRREKECQKEATPDLDFYVVPAGVLEVMRENNLINESKHSAVTVTFSDAQYKQTKTIAISHEPALCEKGCVDVQIEAARLKKMNYVNGTLRLVPAKSARGKKRFPNTTVTGVSSEDTVYSFLLKVLEHVDVELLMIELTYNGTNITENQEVPLSVFCVPNNGTLEARILDAPKQYDFQPQASPANVETGFNSTRLGRTSPTHPPRDGRKKEWGCSVCTFVNAPASKSCEMCGAPR